MNKALVRHERPHQFHMVGDGFRVYQMMPGYGRAMSAETSPFLMLDYNAPWEVPPQGSHRPGVGFHPHRGFETVTIVYEGEIEHRDTHGNGGVIHADEVQWMTAGSGLLHNEFMTADFARMGGLQHVVQLWINLPREHKMISPRYQVLTRDSIPEIAFEAGIIRIISGSLSGKHWPAQTFSPIELYDVKFQTIGELKINFPEWYNAMILVTEGGVELSEKSVGHGEMLYFSQSGTEITVINNSSEQNARILILWWEPFSDPVINYGPFVMSSHEEIMQAFKDLSDGKMWVIPD